MKRIILPEHRMLKCKNLILENQKFNVKLPKFIFNQVKNHKTSLGDNLAFPPEDEYSFDYKILKTRFEEVTDNINKIENLESLDENYLLNHLSKLIKECMDIERPIRENLIKLCENAVVKLLAIPQETVLFNCELVDKIEPRQGLRVMPEGDDDNEKKYSFEDLNEFDYMNKHVMKRRLINSLIQGAAYEYSRMYELYLAELFKVNKRLPELYDEIITINDYLLFIKKEEISDETPMQGAYVEVTLAHHGEKCEINAQGLIFPYLLGETVRGFFELFASHGLPEDNDKAMYIIKQADFLLAEPWDLRMGVILWRMLSNSIKNTKILPYFFTDICKMDIDDFNNTMKEIFAQTKYGKKIIEELINSIEHHIDYNDFATTIQQKNSQEAVITDGYFSADELNDYVIEEDDVDNDNMNQKLSLSIDVLKKY